jgi:phage terminase large subunit
LSAASDQIFRWKMHPDRMVRDLFGVEPDFWQEEGLQAFPTTQRMAFKASKGPGKTCELAWMIWNFLLTRPHPKIAAVSIDRDNLRDNLWTELAYWQQKSPLLSKTFTWTKERIFANDFPETWWCSARSYAKSADKAQQANTLAGLHAEYIMFVLDESGGMSDAIMSAADAALASCTEGHIVQAGNPTHLTGPLYDACTRHKSIWKVIEINGDPDNPKRAKRVNIEWAREQIRLHGKDNPWVLINVFGQFPPSSLNTLIGPDEVRAAMKRYYREYEIGRAPKVLGVDVARFGDDTSVIAPRWGIQMLPLIKRRNIDSTQGAGMVARQWDDWGADGAFIDATGGFGSGWIDALAQLGKAPVGVQFAGKAHDTGRFFNKRCEMAFDFVDWIKAGGALPEDDNLLAALVNTTYTFKGDKFLLEPKDDVKIKIGSSPDEFDACMLTFAEPITAAAQKRREGRSAMPQQYNEFAEMDALAATEDLYRGRSR